MKLFTICVAFFLLSLLQWRGVRDDPFVNNDVIGVYAVTPLHARQVQTQLALSLKRGLLLASLAGISRTATFPLPVYASDRSSLGTPREIANFIRSNCAFTLQAVKQAGSVLYRGEGNTSAATAFIATPPPDLLLPDTYAEYGPIAADYFRTLDQALPALHVAGAHLASTDATEASQWGVVHSCWPLDHGLHYAWLRGEYKWWSNDYAIPQGKYGPFFWKNASKMRKFLNEKVILDANLNNLLARGGEVLFSNAAENGASYLAVPTTLLPKVLSLLDVEVSSDKVDIKTITTPMVIDGDNAKKYLPRLKSVYQYPEIL